MFPSMHDNISRLLEVEGPHFRFQNLDEDIESTHTYDTSIMGRFLCRNRNCQSDRWSSIRIAITIRMYQGRRYNTRVHYQRCKFCERLSEPILDDSYAEGRVSFEEMVWSGARTLTILRKKQRSAQREILRRLQGWTL
jgi:hypothetical protein